MPILIQATAVTVREEAWGLVVSWGIDPPPEDEDVCSYLMLQRKTPFDEQDRHLGHDNVYIECCGQGWSWYGHITRFELHRDSVRVIFAPEAAARMRDDGRVRVDFTVDDPTFRGLQVALGRVFDGFGYYADMVS